MPHSLAAATVRSWCELALEGLGQAREEIDAINVYPVADGDTGTNLYLTVESATQAVEAACAGEPSATEAMRAMAHGALIGARGNSGTILAQLLRGMAESQAAEGEEGPVLARALRRAATSAYEAVAHPVEGTMLTVARAAAQAAEAESGDAPAVALAAYRGARDALAETPGHLEALARAGVVDAGGSGLVTVLGALAEALTGEGRGAREAARPPARLGAGRAGGASGTARCPEPVSGAATGSGAVSGRADRSPEYEVIYLLEAADPPVRRLRERLDALGDSLVVVGGDGLWHVHVHVDDAGAAVEEGVRAGRPYRIRINRLEPVAGTDPARPPAPRACPDAVRAPAARRAVVVLVPGEGLAGLCAEAGATVVTVRPEEPPASGELAAAIRRTAAREVVVLPNATGLRHTAAVAAEQVRGEGVRVSVVPTRSPVQGLAALAVHQPDRRFDEDVVAMTSAAGATRHAEIVRAERRSWTTAGVCQAGDVLGMVEGDVAVIGDDLTRTATTLLDRMLVGGGELVTLVLGAGTPPDLGELLADHVRRTHLAVDTVVYPGAQPTPLLIGVE